MIIRRYNDEKASPAHSGTIRAHEVLPSHKGFTPPFQSAWGYLPGPGTLEPHAHPTNEIYILFKGQGQVTVGEEKAAVSCGDIIEIPANTLHSIENLASSELLWLAFWWQE